MFVEMGSDGAFEITDCPNLKSLQIGDFSFADYHLLELEILPSLQQVVVGSHAFHWSYLFSLSGTAACFFTGRASWTPLYSGCGYAFKKTPFFSLTSLFQISFFHTDLPHLQSISLGYCTLYRCQCIELESRCRLWLTPRTYLSFSQSISVRVLFLVTIPPVEKGFISRPSITRTRLLWRVMLFIWDDS